MLVQEPVQAAIWQCLNHYNYDDALFLAERLHAEVNSDEALFLLATCYYRAGRSSSAYSLLKNHGCPTPQCKYLLARCCVDINKLSEAEAAISSNFLSKAKGFDDIVSEFGDSAPFALRLLGLVYRKTERCPKAVESFKRSLKLNFFLWSSFESLCDLGDKIEPSKVFQAPTTQQVQTICRSVFPSSPVDIQTSNYDGETNAPCPNPQPPQMQLWAAGGQSQSSQLQHTPNIVLTRAPDSVHSSFQDSPMASIVNLLSAKSPRLIQTPDNPDLSSFGGDASAGSTPDILSIPPPPPKPKPKKAPSFSGIPSSGSSNETSRVQKKLYDGGSSTGGGIGASGSFLLNAGRNLSLLTPSFGVLPLTPPVPIATADHSNNFLATPSPGQLDACDVSKAPAIKPMTRQQQLTAHNRLPVPPPVFTQTSNINTNSVRDAHTPSPGSNANVPVRRSSRLFCASSSSVKENNNKSQNQKLVLKGPKKSRTKSSKGTKTAQELNEINKEKTDCAMATAGSAEKRSPGAPVFSMQQQVVCLQKQSADGLASLLQELGRAYQALASYDCLRALELLTDLPPHHYNSCWVLVQVAKAHFELAQYKECEKVFEEVRRQYPYSMLGMEVYSTALWHLQREVQLSTLSHELTDLDKQCAQTWCAIGNCFSLQKEHDVAISYLQRAVQVDPDMAYAYTLLGHEYVLTEELDKAMACFRNAVRVDPRHYNAWYGMGMIYYKQEKFSLAEVHYRKALSINPRSSVLLCHVGVAQHALKRSDNALQTLDKAIAMDKRNPLCKFHRASILFAHDKYKEALSELEELKEIIPKESLVYFLIGKVHKKLGNTHLALMNFSWANDLDPKGANNQIKEAIDKRYVTDDDDPTAGVDSEIDASNDSSIIEGEELQLQAMESDESL